MANIHLAVEQNQSRASPLLDIMTNLKQTDYYVIFN